MQLNLHTTLYEGWWGKAFLNHEVIHFTDNWKINKCANFDECNPIRHKIDGSQQGQVHEGSRVERGDRVDGKVAVINEQRRWNIATVGMRYNPYMATTFLHSEKAIGETYVMEFWARSLSQQSVMSLA